MGGHNVCDIGLRSVQGNFRDETDVHKKRDASEAQAKNDQFLLIWR